MKKEMLMEQELVIRSEAGDERLREILDRRLESIAPPTLPASNPNIDQLIDNSDWNWSDDAYRNAGITPGTAGDPNNRAYNWFRIERATALLVEDDAHSLKGPDHSLFGAESNDTPRWSKTDGWAELGETGATPWDLCCPLPNNFVTPGMRFYIQMLARLRTATALPGLLKFFWMLYDNTNSAPAPQIIKGTAFDLSGGVYGGTGATTRDYQLIVTTDYGNQVESDVLSLANTPATLTPGNGVALSWPRYPGFTKVEIYVTEGGVNRLVYIIGNGASAYNDEGQRLGTVASIPSITDTQAKAYTETREFIPTADWVLWEFAVITPNTYNASLTTGKQWLRGGVIGVMGDGHQLQIDRLGVSTGRGLWSPSSHDKSAASLPSTSQTSSTQGPPEGGGPITLPDGEGSPTCSTRETGIQVCDADGRGVREVRLDHVKEGFYLKRRDGKSNRVKKVRPGWSDSIITIATENGARRRCSPSDLWIVKDGPETGTPARELCESMEVETRINGSVQFSPITVYSVSIRGEEVIIVELEGDPADNECHVYFAGSASSHNAKIIE